MSKSKPKNGLDKTYDRLKEFTDAPALCVVVTVCDQTWMPSVEKAAGFLAQWKVCLGSELWTRSQDTEIAAALEQLGGGARILVVVAAPLCETKRTAGFEQSRKRSERRQWGR